MSCYGDIFLRKDLITCDPKYGVSLNNLVKEIVGNIQSSSSSFTCASLATCSINALSDVEVSSPQAKQLLSFENGVFKNKTFGDVYSIVDLGNVDLPGDLISTSTNSYGSKVLGWNFANKAFELQDAASQTITPSLIVGDTDSPTDDIYASGTNQGKLIISGGGDIAVSYTPSTNTFTITNLTSPSFTGFALVGTSSTASTPVALSPLYFGDALPQLRFYHSGVTNSTSVKTNDKYTIKDGSTTILSNQDYGVLYGPAVSDTYTPSVTNTTFATKSYSINGLNKNNNPFSNTGSVAWGTNYLYGYSFSNTISASDLNNALIDNCSPTGFYKKAIYTTTKNRTITLNYPTKIAFTTSTSFSPGDVVTNGGRLYIVTAGTGTTSTGPTHTSGQFTHNGITFLWISNNINQNPYLFIAIPSNISITSFKDNSNGFDYSMNSTITTLSNVNQIDNSKALSYKAYFSQNTFTVNVSINIS